MSYIMFGKCANVQAQCAPLATNFLQVVVRTVVVVAVVVEPSVTFFTYLSYKHIIVALFMSIVDISIRIMTHRLVGIHGWNVELAIILCVLVLRARSVGVH